MHRVRGKVALALVLVALAAMMCADVPLVAEAKKLTPSQLREKMVKEATRKEDDAVRAENKGKPVQDFTGNMLLDSMKTMSQTKTFYFVKFYAPWCGHCKRLEPVIEQVGVTAQSQFGDKLVVAKVDCDRYRTMCQANNVSGFPTLKLFTPEGKFVDFGGPRTPEALLSFLAKHVT